MDQYNKYLIDYIRDFLASIPEDIAVPILLNGSKGNYFTIQFIYAKGTSQWSLEPIRKKFGEYQVNTPEKYNITTFASHWDKDDKTLGAYLWRNGTNPIIINRVNNKIYVIDDEDRSVLIKEI